MLCLAFALLPIQAFAGPGTTYEVASAEEFVQALQAINTAESGSFDIVLQEDIAFTQTILNFRKNTVTIYGNGHSLTMLSGSYIDLASTAVLNLGSPDYTETLLVTSRDDTRTIIGMSASATLNMYPSASVGQNSRSGGQAGGIQMSGNSIFNMYGGVIYDCVNWASVAGGVLVTGKSTFNMYGGKISNCSGYQGGGVGVIDNGTFHMESGEIIDCTDHWLGGGGVNVFGQGASFTMNGGSITGCQADDSDYGLGGAVFIYTMNGEIAINGGEIRGNTTVGLGGGICVYNGEVAISQQTKLYDNHAALAGDDFFNYGGVVVLGSVLGGLTLDDCSHAIDGWYVDGILDGTDTARWNALESPESPVYVWQYTPQGTAISTQLALKAAHTVYNYTIHYYIDGQKNDALTECGTVPAVSLLEIPDKCPEGYSLNDILYGQVTQPSDGASGEFEVEVYYNAIPPIPLAPDGTPTPAPISTPLPTPTEPAALPTPTNSPAHIDAGPTTGDNLNLSLWFALLFISGAGIIGTRGFFNQKHGNK
nr:hypothetical protein [bacterium]